jgi:hypothetical protein
MATKGRKAKGKIADLRTTLDGWYNAQATITSAERGLIRDTWQAGVNLYLTVQEDTTTVSHYERAYLRDYGIDRPGHVVINWDDYGNTTIG